MKKKIADTELTRYDSDEVDKKVSHQIKFTYTLLITGQLSKMTTKKIKIFPSPMWP